jgi:hypothetical protein
MSSTLTEKAVVGRRITFTYYRDLQLADPPAYPGIITGLVPEQGASLKIRLDGRRSTLHSPPDYQGLRYLDEVVAVPELPMGRFTPTADDLEGVWAGVPVCSIGEDGDLIALTGGREKAIAAVRSYLDDQAWVDLDYVDFDDIRAHWAVFEWEPEDAESPWTVNWDAAEGDDQAIRIHYLPA